jgi:hypothetical protein
MTVFIHQLYKSLPASEFDNVCIHCKATNRILVETHLLEQWRSGQHVQDVFPHLTLDERELILTGTHSECWNEIFADSD